MFSFKVESTAWPDSNKQYRSNAESPRKFQNKYLGNRSQLGKFQNKTNQFNSYSYDEKLNQNGEILLFLSHLGIRFLMQSIELRLLNIK